MQWWKVVGLAGLAGVAATGVKVSRDERQRKAYTPDEVRARLHERVDKPLDTEQDSVAPESESTEQDSVAPESESTPQDSVAPEPAAEPVDQESAAELPADQESNVQESAERTS